MAETNEIATMREEVRRQHWEMFEKHRDREYEMRLTWAAYNLGRYWQHREEDAWDLVDEDTREWWRGIHKQLVEETTRGPHTHRP